ncbi:ABC transporter ATP-binding protein [Nisaea nitritireducens]|uniref:ABC transporter ATP-binding protein n=1 Tax=Nisaea nitritireducens TaxID=568392 RepID=UPI0018696D84|nr:ABC transporter ATP-binding protein [Nisaea nitritireducens]
MSDGTTRRLDLKGITKAFPGVLANDDVSFSVAPGEIHALLGENGAGKSTLVKMIYGIMQPDAGEIRFDGELVHVASPKAARAMGVGMVFQHFSLFEPMTVLENIALGLDEAISYADLEARIREVLETYQLSLDPHRTVATLSVGERQRIEIVRALLLEPRLLIMDEPTSVLTPQEVAQLFDTLRALAARGCSILYISHKLHEIVELCHSATILRGGRVVAECDPRAESSRSMAEMMIGGALKEIEKAADRSFGVERFIVGGLSLEADDAFGTSLKDISFSVRAGEIFGVAGVAGNGQNELMLALSGERPVESAGAINIDGNPVGTLNAEKRRRFGLCAVPEERNGHGAVPGFSLSDNAILTARTRKNMVRLGVIDAGVAESYTNEVIGGFAVKTTGAKAPASSLSGGNLQKFIMGREIMQAPDVLVVSQPTWGVDAGAAAAIHQELVDLAARGSAIVVISQDLDELMAISDTMAVMNEGKLSRTLAVGEASVDEIGLLMGGVHGDPDATADYAGATHAA